MLRLHSACCMLYIADFMLHAQVAWCAGAYVSGADGSNECPAGSVRIETEAACRTAVTAAGKTAVSPFVETFSAYPKGCYFVGNNAYFNAHAVGAGESSSQLLCAAVTTGAPSTPPPLLRHTGS